MAKEQLLFAEHLTKTYRKNGRKQEVLTDVSLRLLQGEILGIVGESGSGKSTLLRQIACLEHPDSGQIFLNGKEITHSRISEICGEMQMIFQDPTASFPARRRVGVVLEEAILQVGHRQKAEAGARAAELMQLTGLSAELLERYPAELSGGQCQRMAIARALAAEPKLLLCDECTSALDPLVQKQILDLLRKLNRKMGVSMLFVSHDPLAVTSLCSRILRIEAGKCQVCERSDVTFPEGKLS